MARYQVDAEDETDAAGGVASSVVAAARINLRPLCQDYPDVLRSMAEDPDS